MRIQMTFLVFLTISINSYAGPSVSGGGDAVVENKIVRFLDLVESDQIEYFVPDLKSFESKSYYWPRFDLESPNSPFSQSPCMNIYTPTVIALGVYPGPEKIHIWGTNYFFMAQNLTWAFTSSQLEDIQDEGVIKYPKDNVHQLAIQKNGFVIVQKQLFDQLNDEDKFALYTHESLLSTINYFNPQLIQKLGTAPIRTFNRHLILYSKGLNGLQSSYPLKVVKDSCAVLLDKSL